jgi:hypothetical protein
MSSPSRFPSYSSLGERCLTPIALLHSSLKVPSLCAHFQFPQQNHYGERCPSPEPSFTHPPGFPSTGALHLLQVLLTEFPQRDASLLEPLRPSLKFLVNEHPSRFPNGFATERYARLHFCLLRACHSKWILILGE